jgi:hypothetical protein
MRAHHSLRSVTNAEIAVGQAMADSADALRVASTMAKLGPQHQPE